MNIVELSTAFKKEEGDVIMPIDYGVVKRRQPQLSQMERNSIIYYAFNHYVAPEFYSQRLWN
jgi:hypothetical protein